MVSYTGVPTGTSKLASRECGFASERFQPRALQIIAIEQVVGIKGMNLSFEQNLHGGYEPNGRCGKGSEICRQRDAELYLCKGTANL